MLGAPTGRNGVDSGHDSAGDAYGETGVGDSTAAPPPASGSWLESAPARHQHVDMSSQEVASGVFRLILPLGIHGMPSVNGYLIADEGGDTLVDCGIAVLDPGALPADDGTGPLEAALAE